MTRRYFDIAIVIPLEEELISFQRVFPSVENLSTTDQWIHAVKASNFSAVAIQQKGMGKEYASQATRYILDNYDVGVVVCIGIAGSLSNDVGLCDVCYTGRVFDVLENAKVDTKTKEGEMDIEFSPIFYETEFAIQSAFNFVRTQPHIVATYETWQLERGALAEIQFPSTFVGRQGKPEQIGMPKSKDGTIACGHVSKNKKYNEKLLSVERKTLAIETESGGVFSVCSERKIPVITIRGISDHADSNKTQIESASSGSIRSFAAENAATFFKIQLENPYFIAFVDRRRSDRTTLVPTTVVALPKSRTIATVLGDLYDRIDQKLRELSPEYNLKQKGYKFPTPRIKYSGSSTKAKVDKKKYFDIREIIASRQYTVINISRTYPDNSTAWVVALDLLTSEISGRQVLPIVLEGEYLKPPNGTIEKVTDYDMSDIEDISSAQVVYIINDISLNPKRRGDFIADEIKSYPDAKFIFVARGEENFISETHFSGILAVEIFDICAVSFGEMALFLQKNFQLASPESEAIALKLRDTFSQFNLSAHPTYFAGIPKETLSALLNANRRTELLQLATDGFMLFVVADDKADVTLSRTTRTKFLKELVVETRVEKRDFSEEEVIGYTKQFATKYDFNIDPIKFIDTFKDKGIIHFENNKLFFSLPFIEMYLLASELSHNPLLAIKYFDCESSEIDLATFDLYCEIGACKEIVDAVRRQLTTYIEKLKLKEGVGNNLLSEKLQPRMLSHPERVAAIHEKIEKTIHLVGQNSSDIENKQRILDIADIVQEKTAEDASAVRGKSDPSVDDSDFMMGNLAWYLGAVLIGSGSEHLDGATKRELARDVSILSELIIHHWIEMMKDVRFSNIRDEIFKIGRIQEIINSSSEEEVAEFKRLVDGLVDSLEMAILSAQFRQMLNTLCEQAGQKVLLHTLLNIEIPSGFKVAELMLSLWAGDIDISQAKTRLKAVVASLPKYQFVRVNVATHCLSRVYWNHWDRAKRLEILDFADETIRPLGRAYEKGAIKRAITSAKKPDVGDDE